MRWLELPPYSSVSVVGQEEVVLVILSSWGQIQQRLSLPDSKSSLNACLNHVSAANTLHPAPSPHWVGDWSIAAVVADEEPCSQGTDCSQWTNWRQICEHLFLVAVQRLLHAHKYLALTVGLYLNLSEAACVSSPVRAKGHVSTCGGTWKCRLLCPLPCFPSRQALFYFNLYVAREFWLVACKGNPLMCCRTLPSTVTILWGYPFSNGVAIGEQLALRSQRMDRICPSCAGTNVFAIM